MKFINFKLLDNEENMDSNLNDRKLKIALKINSWVFLVFLRFSLNSRVSQVFPGSRRNSRVFQDIGNPEMAPLQHCVGSKTEIVLSMT